MCQCLISYRIVYVTGNSGLEISGNYTTWTMVRLYDIKQSVTLSWIENATHTHLLLGRVALVAQQPIVIELSRERSVCLCVLRLVHCGKMADRIRMPFGIVGQTGPVMRQVVGFGNRSTGRGTFGGEFGVRHCPQGPIGRTCATAPRCGPPAKLLWPDLFVSSVCMITSLCSVQWLQFVPPWLTSRLYLISLYEKLSQLS